MVLAVLVAGEAFAQKVGDTGDAFGKKYTVKEVKDGNVLLQPSLTFDGRWERQGGHIITINGNNGVFNQIDSGAMWQDAAKKDWVNAAVKTSFLAITIKNAKIRANSRQI